MSDCFLYNNCNHKDCDKNFCLRRFKLEYLFDNSLLAPAQRFKTKIRTDADGTDLEEFKQIVAIEQDIENWVKSGKNLYIHSAQCGNGKTTCAIRLIQAYFHSIWAKASMTPKALFISVPRFLIEMKNSISQPSEYIDFIKANIINADLVVWDDIAAKMGSEYEINQLLSYIDGRIALGKSNIYTTNLDFRAIEAALGERLASRICNLSTDIELHGSDKRNITQ